MEIVVLADDAMQKAFQEKGVPAGLVVHFEVSVGAAKKDADAYFILLHEEHLLENIEALAQVEKPVFANAVSTRLSQLPANVTRLNGWPGFIERNIIEVSYTEANKEKATSVLQKLNWKYEFVPDIPGLVTARIISSIINEAYFALGEGVSTKEQIDVAMRLGTNYPFGPFEWASRIGVENIYRLLKTLEQDNSRYQVAPALINELSL